MTTVLGKRKLRTPVGGAETTTQDDPRAVFRLHFEARFEPLKKSRPAKAVAPSDLDDEETDSHQPSDSEWAGLSDGDGDEGGGPAVETVDYSAADLVTDASLSMSKRELRAYMVRTTPLRTQHIPSPRPLSPATKAD